MRLLADGWTRVRVAVLSVSLVCLVGCPESPGPLKTTWSRLYGTEQDTQEAFEVVEVPTGGFLAEVRVTESYNGRWLLRVDGSGNEVWSRQYLSGSFMAGIKIGVFSDGQSLVAMYQLRGGSTGDTLVTFELLDADGQLLWEEEDAEAFSLSLIGDSVPICTSSDDGCMYVTAAGSLVKRNRNWDAIWTQSIDSILQTSAPEGFERRGVACLGLGWDDACYFAVLGRSSQKTCKTALYDVVIIRADSFGNTGTEAVYACEGKTRGPSMSSQFKITRTGEYMVTAFADLYGSGLVGESVALLNSAMNVKWVFHCPDDTQIVSAAKIPGGGFMLAGKRETMSGDKAVLIRLDANGQQQWIRDYCIDTESAFNDIEATTDGGLIVAGHNDKEQGEWDIWSAWLLKVNAEGEY